jgi:hypothetical protein
MPQFCCPSLLAKCQLCKGSRWGNSNDAIYCRIIQAQLHSFSSSFFSSFHPLEVESMGVHGKNTRFPWQGCYGGGSDFMGTCREAPRPWQYPLSPSLRGMPNMVAGGAENLSYGKRSKKQRKKGHIDKKRSAMWMDPGHWLSTSGQVAGGNLGPSREAHGLWQPGDVPFSSRHHPTGRRGARRGPVEGLPVPGDGGRIEGSRGWSPEATGGPEVAGGWAPLGEVETRTTDG